MFQRFSIAYKIALAIALLITVAMGLLGMVVVDYQTRLVKGQLSDFGSILISQFAESAKDPILSNDSLGMDLIVANLASDAGTRGAAIYDKSGKILAVAGEAAMNAALLSKKSNTELLKQKHIAIDWVWRDAREQTNKVTSLIKAVRFQDIIAGYVVLTLDRSAGDKLLHDSVSAIRATTILMIALVVIISILMGQSLAKPVHRLVDGLRAITAGQLHYRIREKRNDEIGYLMETFNSMAEGLQKKAQVETVFSRFVSPGVAKRILSDMDNIELGGRHIYASVLFADIVGFTSISEKIEPRQVVELLNEYFSFVSRASELCQGSIDKYMGDCAMVTFGTPEHDDAHSFNAIACCVLIQKIVKLLNARRVRLGLFPVEFRIGVNSGEMLAGYMGSPERMQYTVVGDAVNIASRLCDASSAGKILITEETYSLPEVKNRVIAHHHGSILMKGKANPVETYFVEDIAPPFKQVIDKQLFKLASGKRA